MNDPHNLERFVEAQDSVWPRVLSELRAGRKTSHWMWFVFPQVAGLGFSSMAQRYAIASLDEAAAYLTHPVLGARLVEATQLVLAVEGRSLREILGTPDDLKFRSCVTLFALAPGASPVFEQALSRFFGGVGDSRTEEALNRRAAGIRSD